MTRSPYDVLMISPAADRELITVVYRHLAKRYHPDRDPSPAAAARMAEINDAYSILGDPGKRRRYDEANGVGAAISRPDQPPVGDVSAGTFEAGYGAAGAPPPNPPPDGRPLTFGRYRGWTLNQILRYDRDYLEWLARTTMGRNYKSELDALLRQR